MSIKDVLLIVLPLISVFLGSFLTYLFQSKSRKDEAILRFKEEKYSNLIIALQGFVGVTASGKEKKRFLEEQYKSWLYASDDVSKAINKLIKLLIEKKGKEPSHEEGRELIGNIILEMRKDLLGKTKLRNTDFRYTDVLD